MKNAPNDERKCAHDLQRPELLRKTALCNELYLVSHDITLGTFPGAVDDDTFFVCGNHRFPRVACLPLPAAPKSQNLRWWWSLTCDVSTSRS